MKRCWEYKFNQIWTKIQILFTNYLKEFTIGDETVVIHIVDSEREPQLGQLVALHAELRHSLDELLEIDLETITKTNVILYF